MAPEEQQRKSQPTRPGTQFGVVLPPIPVVGPRNMKEAVSDIRSDEPPTCAVVPCSRSLVVAVLGLATLLFAGGAFAGFGPSQPVGRDSIPAPSGPWPIMTGQRRLETVQPAGGVESSETVPSSAAALGSPKFDFSSSSCGDILSEMSEEDPDARCAYARTCNGGDGLFLPSVFCRGDRSMAHAYRMTAFLSPLLLLYLALLFRMLGSTAEDYFAPCPEMLSTRLGLPPRFAGASLLALGNGAPDVSAAINSVSSDPRNGYDLALGALTGGGMFVGTMVAGMAILANDGVPCRGALLRDVTAYALSIGLVAYFFNQGTVGARAVGCFFLFYCLYASSVLAADLYHRNVVVPRERAKEEKRMLHRQAKMWGEEEQGKVHPIAEEDASADTTDVTSEQSPSTFDQEDQSSDDEDFDDDDDDQVLPLRDQVIEMMSNYDPTMSMRSLGTPVVLHGPGGILAERGHCHRCHLTPHSRDEYAPLSDVAETELASLGDKGEVDVEDGSFMPSSESGNVRELLAHFRDIWDDIFHETKNPLEKLMLALELPFIILRKLTIAVPCDGYYCRPTVALALALSPLWMGVFAQAKYGINLFTFVGILCIPSFSAGALVWRYADEREMSVAVAGPVALYGFIIAATWIDFIGHRLVVLLQFLGVMLHIPSPVMGLTVLAWGDSMGDLAANVALAKKGMANMAMTACFASPLFNMLIGLGVGFSTIRNEGGDIGTSVSISPSVKTGFLFLLCNLAMIPICGRLLNEGKIPKRYSYVMFGLYSCYIVTSILVQFA